VWKEGGISHESMPCTYQLVFYFLCLFSYIFFQIFKVRYQVQPLRRIDPDNLKFDSKINDSTSLTEVY
jgi:hypothetical protein